MDTVLVETYFDWLQSEAFYTKAERAQYEGVLREIHDIPFYWTIVSDDNRAGDAMAFRQYEFLNFQDGLDDMDQVLLGQWATSAPSVLEVLLGMARRWSFYFGSDVQFYFNHLFHNLKLDRYPGKALTGQSQHQIRDRVDVWMSRQFRHDGMGSPLPIRRGFVDGTDMRFVDIWGQMNAYSAEHFQ